VSNRPADLGFVLDGMSSDEQLGVLVDPERGGLAGFSFGGWTALRELANEPRFKAAVALAPGQPGLELNESVASTSAPIMLIAGQMDVIVPFWSADDRIVAPGGVVSGRSAHSDPPLGYRVSSLRRRRRPVPVLPGCGGSGRRSGSRGHVDQRFSNIRLMAGSSSV
jgi:Dienelactone hydrolase family